MRLYLLFIQLLAILCWFASLCSVSIAFVDAKRDVIFIVNGWAMTGGCIEFGIGVHI